MTETTPNPEYRTGGIRQAIMEDGTYISTASPLTKEVWEEMLMAIAEPLEERGQTLIAVSHKAAFLLRKSYTRSVNRRIKQIRKSLKKYRRMP